MPAKAADRMKLAEAMLFDRMCPGGGWNCGNPMVYGVPGEPQVSTTVWSLLALRDHTTRTEIQQSLAWLEKNWSRIQSPASLALTQIALNAFHRANSEFSATLEQLYQPDAVAWSIPVAAWSALAMSSSEILAATRARRNKELNYAETLSIAIAAVRATRIARSHPPRRELSIRSRCHSFRNAAANSIFPSAARPCCLSPISSVSIRWA